ncbi:MAG: ABC transporter ATP-binding protein [Clostridia bacterium]|nr:ABC transporter ATP-binding protein [Clostridia bacterium]
MINVSSLTHRLGDNEVLKDVSLTVPDGCVLGLVGVNGAGKSTLLRLMCGVYLPEKGEILYDGRSPAREETRQEIFFLPDDPYYTHISTVRSMLNMYRALYPDLDMDTYQRLVSTFALDEKKPLRTFSKGMRRQAYVAVALAVRPKYLLLDEAFDGLDPLSRKVVKGELIRLVEECGATVIISSHSLRELEDFCDSYVILHGKSVLSAGDIGEKTSRYCKFMLAFATAVPGDLFAGLPLVSVEQNGKFVCAVFDGEAEEIEARLSAHAPAVLERQPVDFEEAFISEVEGRGVQ